MHKISYKTVIQYNIIFVNFYTEAFIEHHNYYSKCNDVQTFDCLIHYDKIIYCNIGHSNHSFYVDYFTAQFLIFHFKTFCYARIYILIKVHTA